MHSLTVLLCRERSNAVIVKALRCDTVLRGKTERKDEEIDNYAQHVKKRIFHLALISVSCVDLQRGE